MVWIKKKEELILNPWTWDSPGDVEAVVVGVQVQAHGGLQVLAQTLQTEAIGGLLNQLLQVGQHGVQSGLFLQHAAQRLREDDLPEVGIQFLHKEDENKQNKNRFSFFM